MEKYKMNSDCWYNYMTEEYNLEIEFDFEEYKDEIDELLEENPNCENVEDLLCEELLNFIFEYDPFKGSGVKMGSYIKSVKWKGEEIPKQNWKYFLTFR